MVLIAVLWMVAALSIIVTGVSRSVREESRVVSRARQSVEALALGDAAIQIVLQSLSSRTGLVGRAEKVEVLYRGVPMTVQIMPLNGLIDINGAPMQMLSRLYAIAGGLPVERAEALAQATVTARERKDSRGGVARFEAVEDLLQVPGVDYSLYARLSGLVTADLRSGGKVNPLAAPLGVLTVLAGGNASVASRIAADREAGVEGIDTTALDAGFTDNTTVRRFRIEARVPMVDGAWFRISRSVDLGSRARSGVPWHTFSSSHRFEPVGSKDF
jgi:general secretion pathway protein K